MLPVYVISNGDLVKATFDAIAIVLNSDTFNTAIKLATTFSVFGAGLSYVRGRDVTVFFKWFLIYFSVTAILVGPKKDVQIIDTSNPGAVYKVDNLPLGLALPASLITSTAHGLVVALEDAYHMPDEFAYNKTGMLFGSKVFKLSTGFHFINPQVKNEFNYYVKNCVLGDILINKKYTIEELKNSHDVMTIITESPSERRGVFIGEGFKTCKEFIPIMKEHIKKDVEEQSKIFGLKVFGNIGNKGEHEAAEKLKTSLVNTYHYYAGISNSALQIMTQNVLINGLRDGILNYASETQASAAFLNLSTTQAMERMRLSWATSRNMAAYIIPVMHTDILLMLFCLFPVIVMLCIQPNIGPRVLKNYIYSILWVESWPILFACLNLTVSFYAQGKTGALGKGGLTLSNIDLLALEHSDIANMAGYLMITIPFIAVGLVTGMAHAFSSAAAYIGGVLQSSAIQASSEAASGNISLGIASWGNVNANKFDTNSALMRGHSTEQLDSSVLKTITADGTPVFDASHALSRLSMSFNVAKGISNDFSRQAGTESQAAATADTAYHNSLSQAESDLASLNKHSDFQKVLGTSYSQDDVANIAKHYSTLNDAVNTVSKHKHCTREAALDMVRSFSWEANLSGEAKVSAGAPLTTAISGSISGGVDGRVGMGTNRSIQNKLDYSTAQELGLSHKQIEEVRTSTDAIKSFSVKQHADQNYSEAVGLANNISQNLTKADNFDQSRAIHKSESQRFAEMSNYAEHNAVQINAQYDQPFVNWLTAKIGDSEVGSIVAAKTIEDQVKLRSYFDQFAAEKGIYEEVKSNFDSASQGINPKQLYNEEKAAMESLQQQIKTRHQTGQDNLEVQAKEQGVKFPKEQYNSIISKVGTKHNEIESKIDQLESNVKRQYQSAYQGAKNELEVTHKTVGKTKRHEVVEKQLLPKE